MGREICVRVATFLLVLQNLVSVRGLCQLITFLVKVVNWCVCGVCQLVILLVKVTSWWVYRTVFYAVLFGTRYPTFFSIFVALLFSFYTFPNPK